MFEERPAQNDGDLMILEIDGDEQSGWKPAKPAVFLRTPAIEREPMFSPDGRWTAYSSNETGKYEVYVRPFPGPGAKPIISDGGGTYPTWSRTSRELYYGTPTGQIAWRQRMSERARPCGSKSRGPGLKPTTHCADRIGCSICIRMGDDSRWLRRSRQILRRRDHVGFMFNFFGELRRLAPTVSQ